MEVFLRFLENPLGRDIRNAEEFLEKHLRDGEIERLLHS